MSIEKTYMQTARELIAQHGELKQVVGTRESITFIYSDGHRWTDNVFMKFGYVGQGPACFRDFLHVSGVELSTKAIDGMGTAIDLRRVGECFVSRKEVRVSASTVEGAEEKASLLVPENAKVIETKVIRGDKLDNVEGKGNTENLAVNDAKNKIPMQSRIKHIEIIQEPKRGKLTSVAYSENEAKTASKSKLPDGAEVKTITCVKRVREGIFGFGKKPGTFELRWLLPWKVIISYRANVYVNIVYEKLISEHARSDDDVMDKEENDIMDKKKIRSLIQIWSGDSRTSEGIDAHDKLLNWASDDEFTSDVYDELIAGLSHADCGVREGCAWTLGGLGNRHAIQHLGKLVSDPNYCVRREVAWSLGKIGEPECLPYLETLLEDNIGTEEECRIVRDEASKSIRQIERKIPNAFRQKYPTHEAIWRGSSFDDVDFRSLLADLPVLSCGSIHPLKGKYDGEYRGDLDYICNILSDVLRSQIGKASVKECFIRPDGDSGYWEVNISYYAGGDIVIAPHVVARSGDDEYYFFSGVVWY